MEVAALVCFDVGRQYRLQLLGVTPKDAEEQDIGRDTNTVRHVYIGGLVDQHFPSRLLRVLEEATSAEQICPENDLPHEWFEVGEPASPQLRPYVAA